LGLWALQERIVASALCIAHVVSLWLLWLWAVQKPINPYGKAKKMAEDLIKDYARTNKKLAVTLLRCCTVLCCPILECTVLHCAVWHGTLLSYTLGYGTVSYCTVRSSHVGGPTPSSRPRESLVP